MIVSYKKKKKKKKEKATFFRSIDHDIIHFGLVREFFLRARRLKQYQENIPAKVRLSGIPLLFKSRRKEKHGSNSTAAVAARGKCFFLTSVADFVDVLGRNSVTRTFGR
jgi:hypothetical protein